MTKKVITTCDKTDDCSSVTNINFSKIHYNKFSKSLSDKIRDSGIANLEEFLKNWKVEISLLENLE